jgi:DNA-binding LytR/AlgR family response regulator
MVGRPSSNATPATPRLPRELLLVYLVVPFFVTPVVETSFFEYTAAEMASSLTLNAIICWWIACGIHTAYRFVLPAVLAHARRPVMRGAAHVAMSGLVALLGALSIRSLLGLFIDELPEADRLMFNCVTLNWAFLLPALVVQALRDRAELGERRLAEQRQAALTAQLEAIQARTNPHFMFNAMNTIASLVKEDPVLAERTIERLADVLRYALQSSRAEMVTLGDELAMIKDYLEIQRARFGERLRYTLEIAPGLERASVPPLLVQPLIENAVLHGVGQRIEGGMIRLVARRDGDRIELTVDDDGPGPGASTHHGSGTSLGDLARRIVRVLVVDDEAPARRRIIGMLAELPEIELVGEANDGFAALAEIERARPDLVLLDISMPGLDGLSLAARYASLPPVVFITAHDQHAVRAFEVNAVDYLLKPVRPERLAAALRRVAERASSARDGFRALAIDGRGEVPRVVTHERGKVRLFDARTITRFRAVDKYTAFVVDGEEHLTEEPLSLLEERLGPHGFVRVHRAELVSKAAIETLTTRVGFHEAQLRDGQVVRVSRRLAAALKKQLGE